ncbi:MAG: mechanosensitive ion channel [Ignavibacteriales bacterium]|nr:mechanosensitive ion channel [Ignavibacteriales bacterium]
MKWKNFPASSVKSGDCTKGNEEILLNPAPSVFFKDFADSALLFELRCWTENFNSWLQIQSDLRVEIEKVLRENGIEIPFPQTDVHIKSGDLLPAKRLNNPSRFFFR